MGLAPDGQAYVVFSAGLTPPSLQPGGVSRAADDCLGRALWGGPRAASQTRRTIRAVRTREALCSRVTRRAARASSEAWLSQPPGSKAARLPALQVQGGSESRKHVDCHLCSASTSVCGGASHENHPVGRRGRSTAGPSHTFNTTHALALKKQLQATSSTGLYSLLPGTSQQTQCSRSRRVPARGFRRQAGGYGSWGHHWLSTGTVDKFRDLCLPPRTHLPCGRSVVPPGKLA